MAGLETVRVGNSVSLVLNLPPDPPVHFQAQLMNQALHDLMLRTDIAEQVRAVGVSLHSCWQFA